MKSIILFLLVVLAAVFWFPRVACSQEDHPTICLTGDSQAAPGSPLALAIAQHPQTANHFLRATGRRGWTAQRWINHLEEWQTANEGCDVVIISLGGNDRAHGLSWTTINRRVADLITTLNSSTQIFHMPVPRFYSPLLETPGYLNEDGIHLSRMGARLFLRRVIVPAINL